jgi:hypothetical protein
MDYCNLRNILCNSLVCGAEVRGPDERIWRSSYGKAAAQKAARIRYAISENNPEEYVSYGLVKVESHIETNYKLPVEFLLPRWIKAFLGVNTVKDLLLAVKTIESSNPVSNYSVATEIGDFLTLG